MNEIKIIKLLPTCIAILVIIFSFHSYAETARFNVVKDVWVSAYSGEEDFNMGATSKLKLKGIQEMVIIDFDLSSLSGKKIENATLFFCDVSKNNKLRKIGISTVASPWIEGKSRKNSVDKVEKGASFSFSSYQLNKWAGNRSDLTDVTMGSGNTLQHHTELKREQGMWWSVDLAPALIKAIIMGKSYGLLIMDESGQTFANNYIYSRGSKRFSPYIMISFSEEKKKIPQKLKGELFPSFDNAHIEYGAMILRISNNKNIFAYDIFINGEKVPLWRVPRPNDSGIPQDIILDWLAPEKKINLAFLAIDDIGQKSKPSLLSGYASKSLPIIDFPAYDTINQTRQNQKMSKSLYPINIWAVPELTKVDPISGDILFENNAIRFDLQNPIWSAANEEITLEGTKGEVVGFQLVIERDTGLLDELEFEASSLVSTGTHEISPERFTFYHVQYLNKEKKWYPELVIPILERKKQLNIDKRFIKNQKYQLVYVDLSIPYEINAGYYKGNISIIKNGRKLKKLHMNLTVANIEMPKDLNFVPELNMYKGPGKVGSNKFFNAHRLAHEHRTVINRVPYSQNGRVHDDMIPRISYLEDGQFKIDWTDYDHRLAPLFDGTAFVSGDRKGIPVEKFYLPFFENWPCQLDFHYKYKHSGKRTQSVISRHALEAEPIENSFTAEYKHRFFNMIMEFKDHFEEKGWTHTEFQFYLNNKWKWKAASSWWDLDEPRFYDDCMALKFFGAMFQQAKMDSSAPFIFRADISRPRWQHDWLNSILQRMYVQNNAFFKYSDKVRRLKRDANLDFSVYGSLNDIEYSNYKTVMWCMQAFVEGADGVLPWQSLGGAEAFFTPDRNAIIVDAKKIIDVDWIVSLRLKALRRGQQNVELLFMLEKKFGYKREQIRDFFYKYFYHKDILYKKNSKNSDVKFNTWKMENFRKALIEMLLEQPLSYSG